MTTKTLQASTRKDLAVIAREHAVAGWHGMRKDELIEALTDVFDDSSKNRLPVEKAAENDGASAKSKAARRSPKAAASSRPVAAEPAGKSVSDSNPARETRPAPAAPPVAAPKAAAPAEPAAAPHDPLKDPRKDLSTVPSGAAVEEVLDAVAHDPHWLHVRWVLKRCTVARAAAGLGSKWHRAAPVLRVFRVIAHDTKSTSETVLKDVPVHGGTDHWFVPVETPPCKFRVQIGYLADDGTFFPLAKSRRVTTPRPGSKAAERTRMARPAPSAAESSVPTGAPIGAPSRPASADAMFEKFRSLRADYAGAAYGVGEDGHAHAFTVATELLIRGTAHPDSTVTLSGDTVRVGPDGRFAVKMHLGDGRHVIPAVCVSPDKSFTQTTVLAFGRQSKVLEPQTA